MKTTHMNLELRIIKQGNQLHAYAMVDDQLIAHRVFCVHTELGPGNPWHRRYGRYLAGMLSLGFKPTWKGGGRGCSMGR